MGILQGICAWCDDYHCCDSLPNYCYEKQQEYQAELYAKQKAEYEIWNAKRLAVIDEDNKRRYAEYLARNGGVTDFERMTANFKGVNNG